MMKLASPGAANGSNRHGAKNAKNWGSFPWRPWRLGGFSLLVLAACAGQAASPSFPPSSHPGCETAESCDARCAQGDAVACGVMGAATRSGVVPGGAARAFAYFRSGCEGGDGRSCTNLGYAYNQGTSMEPDQ